MNLKMIPSILLIGLWMFAGCSNNLKLVGTVTYSDGTPVTTGMVNFDSGKETFMGKIDQQGHYSPSIQGGRGIPPGNYRVWLSGTTVVPNIEGPNNTVHQGKPVDSVARKYCNPDTSGLLFESQNGNSNRFDIVVEKP